MAVAILYWASLAKGRNERLGSGFIWEKFLAAYLFLFNHPNSNCYEFAFRSDGLSFRHFDLSFEWMVAIAYYRGAIPESYRIKGLPQRLAGEISSSDVIVAPIADNRMFALLSAFFRNAVTDVETLHSLAAIHLGEQYVMKSERATKALRLLSCAFVSDPERLHYKKERKTDCLRSKRTGKNHVTYGRKAFWSEYGRHLHDNELAVCDEQGFLCEES